MDAGRLEAHEPCPRRPAGERAPAGLSPAIDVPVRAACYHPSRMMKNALLAIISWAAVAMPAAAQTPAPAPAPGTGPEADWRFSAFVSDVFDGERAIGLRWRLGQAGA